ncbi:ABC transporter substrate-binding protein [Kitasatospora sp. NPDC048365]|uniref:ABC transporter substrate-binding protein n=1 Tax=Kitasatospora sp. NPDC048365 TaxID=3364050 RepID=UPI00371A3D48
MLSSPRPIGLTRRRLLALAAASTAATAFASACSPVDGPSDGTTGSSTEAVTLWGWAKGTRETVAAFNAAQSDVRVEFKEIPSGNAGGYARITEALRASTGPDLFNVEYLQLPDYVTRGQVQELTGALPAGTQDRYLSQAMELTTFRRAVWALPLDVAPQLFYYRKDVFARAGVKPPRTWDEFRTAAQRIRQAEPNARIATFFPDDPATFAALAWQGGGHWFTGFGDTWSIDVDDPPTRRVAAYWERLIREDLVRVTPSFSAEWTASLQKGETVGYLGASWGGGVLGSTVPDDAGKWAAAPMPCWGDRSASGMLGGSTFAVAKDSRRAAAAVRFALWATTTAEGIQARIATGTSSMYPAAPNLVPVAREAFKSSFFQGQDLYGLSAQSAEAIQPGWQWGPATMRTHASLKSSFASIRPGSASIEPALETAERVSVDELRKEGFTVVG